MEARVVWKRTSHTEDGKPLPITTSLCLGRAFHLKSSHVIIGTQEGTILFLPLFEAQTATNGCTLEGQGGAITCITTSNITNTGPLDLLAGDSRGNVLTFSFGSRVCTQAIDQPILALLLHRDLYANSILLVGDQAGFMTGLRPLIKNEKVFKVPIGPVSGVMTQADQDWSVTELISFKGKTQGGLDASYILVATKSPTLHFYSAQSKVFSINFPSNINAICTGYFDHNSKDGDLQIAVACDNGEVFTVTNFEAKLHAKIDLVLTKIAAFRADPSENVSEDARRDMILGVGHFNGLVGIEEGKQCFYTETEDWVSFISVSGLDKDSSSSVREYVAIGMMNNCIEVLDLRRKGPLEAL